MTNQKLKVCSICKKKKELSDYNNNKTKSDGLQCHCRDCNRERSKAYYASNKEVHKQTTSERKKKVVRANQQYVYDLVKNTGCIDCGEQDPRCLEFDHVRGIKSDNISHMIAAGCGLSKLLDEIAKCEIRCANCHRKKTALDQNWYCNIDTGQ